VHAHSQHRLIFIMHNNTIHLADVHVRVVMTRYPNMAYHICFSCHHS